MVLESTRPVTLAKGQPKEIESTFLAPQVGRAMQVRERAGGARVRAVAAIASCR